MTIFIDSRFDEHYRRHPLVLVDVGARGGLKSNWAAARPHLRWLGFEPDSLEFERLADGETATDQSSRVFNVALHDRRGPLDLYVARDRGLTSMFEPNRAFLDAFPDAHRWETTGRAKIRADALDDHLGSLDVRDVDFIKVDTQGSELFVLRGASRTLAASVTGVEVEVEFTPIYKDQPLFADVDTFLRGLGFLLFDLRPCYWKRAIGHDAGGPYGQIIWADALYLKSPLAMRESVSSLQPDLQKSKVLRALSISLLYGYYDYALELANGAGDVLTLSDSTVIERQLRDAGGRHDPLPRFPGKRLLRAAAQRVWRLFADSHEGWSVSAGRFGNLE